MATHVPFWALCPQCVAGKVGVHGRRGGGTVEKMASTISQDTRRTLIKSYLFTSGIVKYALVMWCFQSNSFGVPNNEA